MTEHTNNQNTSLNDLIQLFLKEGYDNGLPRIAEMILNAAMLFERRAHLAAYPYERSENRNGYANGFKDKTLKSTLGEMKIKVPQTRESSEPFYPSLLEKGSRIDQALKSAIAEMYLQGVSTRRVKRVMEELCGMEVSSTQVSRLTAKLDESLEKWRNRPLPEISHLLLDATYIKVRIDSSVRDCAVLVGIGIRRDNGKRMILGTSTALSENEVHWRTFLSSLRERGIGIPALITSDAHEGLKAALRATLNASPWQRCQFHLQQNAQAYVPKVSMRQQVADDIRYIFNARNRAEAETRLNEIVEKYSQSAPDLARWMESAIPEGLTIFAFPENIRRRLRTSNMCETLNSQIKRRTRVAGLFPNEASILRLVSAILMDISEEWESGKTYLPQISKN
jgi:transposase-like protein